MTFKQNFKLGMTIVCLLLLNNLVTGQSLVKTVDIQDETATVHFDTKTPKSYMLKIAGPNDYRWEQMIKNADEFTLTNLREDGNRFADGLYKLQITPMLQLTEAQQAELLRMREERGGQEVVGFWEKHNLPTSTDAYFISLRIHNGAFVSPNRIEAKMKTPSDFEQITVPEFYASLQPTPMPGLEYKDHAMDHSLMAEDAQVFSTDVVVIGSICVGFDCPTAPNFGSDTQRLRENNLRIHFDDTSNSGSFPDNDWRLVANETTNGGREFFAIEDATAGRYPFVVEAGAPTNSLIVEADGDIGLNVMDPVVELHMRDGDSPTLRLEQDPSSGFQAQTWDIVGNEANFFVRDVSNGSELPFKIRPGADDNSLVIDNDNNIGIGILNATADLHVFGNDNDPGDVYVQKGSVGINVAPTSTYALDVAGTVRITGNPIVTGTSTFRGDESHFLTTGATFFGANFMPFVKFDATTGRVGIGNIASPAHLLELAADDAAKPNGGVWTASSDRRLKQNIKKYTDGLDEILKINTVTYNYNSKSGYDTSKEYVGVIAQEMQKIAPYMVRKLNPEKNDYLGFEGTALTFMLVNAVQEQQELIEAQEERIAELEGQLSEVAALKQAVAELTQMVKGQSSDTAEAKAKTEMSKDRK